MRDSRIRRAEFERCELERHVTSEQRPIFRPCPDARRVRLSPVSIRATFVSSHSPSVSMRETGGVMARRSAWRKAGRATLGNRDDPGDRRNIARVVVDTGPATSDMFLAPYVSRVVARNIQGYHDGATRRGSLTACVYRRLYLARAYCFARRATDRTE